MKDPAWCRIFTSDQIYRRAAINRLGRLMILGILTLLCCILFRQRKPGVAECSQISGCGSCPLKNKCDLAQTDKFDFQIK
jgi:hypothetical protein